MNETEVVKAYNLMPGDIVRFGYMRRFFGSHPVYAVFHEPESRTVRDLYPDDIGGSYISFGYDSEVTISKRSNQ